MLELNPQFGKLFYSVFAKMLAARGMSVAYGMNIAFRIQFIIRPLAEGVF
jgi:hypothetical protein